MAFAQTTINFPVKRYLNDERISCKTKTKNNSSSDDELETTKCNRENDENHVLRRSTRKITPSKLRESQTKVGRTPRKKRSSPIEEIEESDASPPKREKTEEETDTPTKLINSLKINSPTQENKEEDNKDKSFTPKRLFNNTGSSLRKALHGSSGVTSLPGREVELEKLRTFLKTRLESDDSGSLYISGPPGTGKTASLELVMNENQLGSKFKYIYVNCTSMKSAASIYGRICQELKIKNHNIKSSEKKNLAAVEKYLITKHKMILLVLDEVDQLTTRNQSVLYTIFEWPALSDSRFALISISNTLDLTDRILPRLHSNVRLLPEHIIFRPYSSDQLTAIIVDRLCECNGGAFPLAALRLLAAKVAAVSGDARRALDIARRAVETSDLSAPLKEEEQNDKNENTSNSELTDMSNKSNQISPPKKCVEVKQVLQVFNSVYGNPFHKNDEEEEEIPLYQQIALATLLLVKGHAKNKDLTISRFYEIYKEVCKKRYLTSDQSEFISICRLIETRGVWRIIGKKNILLCKITLQWDEDEVSAALRDKQLLSDILSDTSCLIKKNR